MPALIDQLNGLCEQFRQQPTPEVEEALRLLRLQLAQALAGADGRQAEPLAHSELMAAWRLLRTTGLIDYGLMPVEREACAPWSDRVRQVGLAPETVGSFLACALYRPAHEWAPPCRWEAVPRPLLADCARYLFAAPALLLEPGEAERFARHVEGMLTTLEQAPASVQGPVDELLFPSLDVVQSYFSEHDLSGLMRARARLLERHLRRLGFVLEHLFAPRREPRDRIHLGLLAPAYGPNAEGAYALAHLAALDRARFHVTLYALHSDGNHVEQKCRALVDDFVQLPTALGPQVARVRGDDLDLFLLMSNVSTVTSNVLLMAAHRLARVQATSMAPPVTTGLSHMEHFVSAEMNESEGSQAHYTERLWKMPLAINHYAFDDEPPSEAAPVRAQLGLTDDNVVYFSGANFYKIIPEQTCTWARILDQVPGSVLLLMPFNRNWRAHYPEFAFKRRLVRDFDTVGVDPQRVCILDPVATRGDLLNVLRLADVYLDPFPFAGACSMFDPLQLGMPAVARAGRTARSSHGAAMLRRMDADDLVAHDEVEYIRLAVELGRDPQKRTALRTRLQQRLERGNPALDSAELGRQLNPVLEAMAATAEHLETLPALQRELQRRAPTLHQRRVRGLSDLGLVRTLILPAFPSPAPAAPLHMVDVGACYGEIAAMFLRHGWTADLYEPDPACRQVIAQATAEFSEHTWLHPVAVSQQAREQVPFHKAETDGLSGLQPSPYGKTQTVLQVPVVRLDEHLRGLGRTRVDFLKIDTEGQDLLVLASHDFAALPPRLVLVEVDTEFAPQTHERIRQAFKEMRQRGYEGVLFNYEDEGAFKRGQWDQHWLKDVLVLEDLLTWNRRLVGNIVFFRQDDRELAARLLGALDAAVDAACLPAPQRAPARASDRLCQWVKLEGNGLALDVDLFGFVGLDVVGVEFTSVCNLRCLYCNVSAPGFQGKHTDPALLHTAHRLVSEEKPRWMNFTGIGELTVMPRWHEAVKPFMGIPSMMKALTTNLQKIMDDGEIAALAAFDQISISIDTADAKLLRRIRGNSELRNITTNLTRLRAHAIKEKRRPPSLRFNVVVTTNNALTLVDLAAYAVACGIDDLLLIDLNDRDFFIQEDAIGHVSRLGDAEFAAFSQQLDQARQLLAAHGKSVVLSGDLEHYIQARQSGQAARGLARGQTRLCRHLWNYAVIKEDGRLSHCCANILSSGSLNASSFADLMDTDVLRAYRRALIQGQDLPASCLNCHWAPAGEPQQLLQILAAEAVDQHKRRGPRPYIKQ